MQAKKANYAVAAVVGILSTCAHAAPDQWSAVYAASSVEYSVGEGTGSRLIVRCYDDEDRQAVATIGATDYFSNVPPGIDVVVDGKTWPNAFHPDGLQASDNFVPFWAALRKAKTLKLKAGKTVAAIPTKGLSAAVPPLKDGSCFTPEAP
jgi:hypothetical protein